MLNLVSEAGDLGLLIYRIVEDHKSAFIAICAYIASAGVGKPEFKDVAGKLRVQLPPSTITFNNHTLLYIQDNLIVTS